MTTAKRQIFGRGKGYFSDVGPQSRFILFLLFVLVVFTLLLMVFQKLAGFLPLFVFFPIALLTLLFFIGAAGTIYSHSIVGALVRIRRTLYQLAEGDRNVTLRLRDSDDPLLKDVAKAIMQLCEQSRNSRLAIQETTRELSEEISAIREAIGRSSARAEIEQHLDRLQQKQELLHQAIVSFSNKK